MRDPDTIAEEIESERARLAESLKELDDRFSPDAIVDQAAEAVRRHGSKLGDMAKDNPLAVALIGSGVAWLLAGSKTSPQEPGPPLATRPKPPMPMPAEYRTETRADVNADARAQEPAAAAYDPRVKPTSPGLSQPQAPMAGFDSRVAAADQAMRHDTIEGDDTMSMTGTGYSDIEADGGFRSRARQSAGSMRARLNDGLEKLPESARARILSARLKAIEAQAAVEAQIMRGSDGVRRTARENPLLVGAIAFGVGAAIAAALPRTSTENRTVGAHRDSLLDEADRVFREETSKLRAVAEAAVEEGKSAVKDTLRSGPPTDDDPVDRVRDAAKKEADRQNVGKVN